MCSPRAGPGLGGLTPESRSGTGAPSLLLQPKGVGGARESGGAQEAAGSFPFKSSYGRRPGPGARGREDVEKDSPRTSPAFVRAEAEAGDRPGGRRAERSGGGRGAIAGPGRPLPGPAADPRPGPASPARPRRRPYQLIPGSLRSWREAAAVKFMSGPRAVRGLRRAGPGGAAVTLASRPQLSAESRSWKFPGFAALGRVSAATSELGNKEGKRARGWEGRNRSGAGAGHREIPGPPFHPNQHGVPLPIPEALAWVVTPSTASWAHVFVRERCGPKTLTERCRHTDCTADGATAGQASLLSRSLSTAAWSATTSSYMVSLSWSGGTAGVSDVRRGPGLHSGCWPGPTCSQGTSAGNVGPFSCLSGHVPCAKQENLLTLPRSWKIGPPLLRSSPTAACHVLPGFEPLQARVLGSRLGRGRHPSGPGPGNLWRCQAQSL